MQTESSQAIVMNEPKAEQEPRFTRALNRGLSILRPVFQERSAQYGDTMAECRWLTMKSVALAMGIELKDDEARILFLAGQGDVKYWRQLGEFKADNLIDGLAYGAALIGELDASALINGHQQAAGAPPKDPAPRDLAAGPKQVDVAPLRGLGPDGGSRRADIPSELSRNMLDPRAHPPGP